jgi:hypothetical protein
LKLWGLGVWKLRLSVWLMRKLVKTDQKGWVLNLCFSFFKERVKNPSRLLQVFLLHALSLVVSGEFNCRLFVQGVALKVVCFVIGKTSDKCLVLM